MAPTRRFLLLVIGLASLLAPARAAVLIHDYVLPNNAGLADTRGGPALTSLGGHITALGYVFAANQGLLFTSSTFNPAAYSLEFTFHFDSTAGYDKIVDFHQLSVSNDSGLYQRDGLLNFYPVAQSVPPIPPQPPDFVAGTTVSVVLTRGTDNVVAGYINGNLRFGFVDTAPLAVSPQANGNLNFFVDDRNTGQREAASGIVSSIRIYNGALTPLEVRALAIPEPSTTALLVVGASIVYFAGRRRRRA